MNSFFDSQLCHGGDACRRCRRSRLYRKGIVAAFDEPQDIDFECPEGKTEEDYPQEIEPNIFQMGMNLAKALNNERKSKAPPITQKEIDLRMEVCRDCQFLIDGKRCAKCGCFMKFKARLRSGECPIGKWRIVEITEEE